MDQGDAPAHRPRPPDVSRARAALSRMPGAGALPMAGEGPGAGRTGSSQEGDGEGVKTVKATEGLTGSRWLPYHDVLSSSPTWRPVSCGAPPRDRLRRTGHTNRPGTGHTNG